MLTSPLTITIDGAAKSFSRINMDNYSSVYLCKGTNEEFELIIRHTREGKASAGQIERHNVDMKHTTWDVNGVPTVTQTYHVIRNPRNVPSVRVQKETAGLNTFVSANIAAICDWES